MDPTSVPIQLLSQPPTVLVGGLLVVLVLWVTNVVDPAFTGLAAIGFVGLVVSTEAALVGFASPATWLIVFGLLIGEGVRETGLSTVAKATLIERAVPSSAYTDRRRLFLHLLVLLCGFGVLFSIVIPSSLVRVLILSPIVVDIGDAFDTRRARIGLFLAPLIATYYGGLGVLTGSLPNIVIIEIARTAGGVQITWSRWFVQMFPLMGIGRALVIAGVTYLLYKPSSQAPLDVDVQVRSVRTARSRRMLLFLLVGVAIWMSDFVHQLHPMYGAFAIVGLMYLPRVGTMEFEDVADVDFSIVFFVAAVFAIAEALSVTGIAAALSDRLVSTLPLGAPTPVILAVVFGSTVALTFLMEGVAVASVLTPVFVDVFGQTGYPMTEVLMTEAIALGTYFFPYQSGVLIAILGEGVVDARQLITAVSVYSIATTVVLVPLQFLLFAVI